MIDTGADKPDPKALTVQIVGLIENKTLRLETGPQIPWRSGVYNLIDAIFSSQVRYRSVVTPMLRNRLPRRSGLADTEALTFSRFVADVDSFGADKFERYSVEALTRHKLSGRTKTEVCYEAATFLRDRGLETMANIQAMDQAALRRLILSDLQNTIKGIGPRLAPFLLMRFGVDDLIKADVMVYRFFARLSDWKPRAGDSRDIAVMQEAVRAAAIVVNVTAAQIDAAIWRLESDNGGIAPAEQKL